MWFSLIAAAPVAIWVYLFAGRGGYWRVQKHLLNPSTTPPPNRKIVAVIPARNEVDVVAESLQSLLRQELPQPLHIILVDDSSNDGTADVAKAATSDHDQSNRLTIVPAKPLPEGWKGKLWAVSQGIEQAELRQPDYLLLTDADIAHAPGAIASLLCVAEEGRYDLSSLMVRLATETLGERLLIPAFLYFFLQLYPPAWTSDQKSKTAGAAGGCMLIRSEALKKIGGIQTIRNAMIDDCALAAAVKKSGGSVWMGLSTDTVSLRSYGNFEGVGRMISRSAFNQLNHSSVLLALTLVALMTVYVLPPILLLSRHRKPVLLGAVASGLMFLTYYPAVRLYRRPRCAVLTLPLVALFYAGATVHSALRYWARAGGEWKGRMQDR